MILSLGLSLLVLAAVLVELIVPDSTRFHNGWYIVAIASLAVMLALRARKHFAPLRTANGRVGFILASFGVGGVALAGVAFGLFAPDPQTVAGAPGATVSVENVALHFPLATDVGSSRSLDGSAFLDPVPRTVVGVDVTDSAGRHLTITQPTGAAFLSPILLMQSTQTIGSLTVPYDSFAVPALHRVAKAVLLDRAALSQMPALATSDADGAVLFDVEDENEVPVPHGIGVALDGQSARLGGLILRPHLLSYPAIRVLPLPNPWIVGFGTLAAIVGFVFVGIDARNPLDVKAPLA